jgi:hypothetical protein
MTEPTRKCRICGCTETSACSTPSGPCHWVDEDLCSACTELDLTDDDIKALAHAKIPIVLDGVSALQLLSGLQLALRHPEFTGPASKTARDFAIGLAQRLSVTPNLAKVCRAGFDERFDRPADCHQAEAKENVRRIILPGE